MIRLRKVVSLSVAVLMAASIFAGCNKTADNKNTQTTASATTSSAVTEAEKKPVKIVTYLGTQKAEDEKVLLDPIKAKFPEISIENMPFSGSAAEMQDKLALMLLAGQELDLVAMSDDNTYDRYQKMGVLEPLNDLVKKENVSLVDNLMKKADRGGKFYALPYRSSIWVTYYNKDLFDAASVPYPTEDWTWEDFKEIAKKLTKGEGTDKVFGVALPDWTQTWSAPASQAGVSYVKADGTPNLDAPEFLNFLKMRLEMQEVDKSILSVPEIKTTKVHYSKAFSTGKYAMLLTGEWGIGQIKSNLEGKYTFKYDLQVLPHPKGTKPTSWGAACWYGIAAKSGADKKDAAWRIASFLSSAEGAEYIAALSWTPAVNSPKSIETFKKTIPEFVSNADVIFKPHEFVLEKPVGEGADIYMKYLQEESDMALTGGKTPEQALKDATKRIIKGIEDAAAAKK